MKNNAKEVQEYLHNTGIDVSETAIVDAAIRIATRGGGNYVFVCEFKKEGEDEKREKLSFDDIPVHIRERVYSDIGEASMCWENPGGCGVFNSTNAARIGLELCQFILDQKEEEKER